jgi:hypothetical protein
MIISKNKTRVKKGMAKNRHMGCPLTNNHSPWCFQMCKPDEEKAGYCGRAAPHGVRGRTQVAIDEYKQRKQMGS